MPIVERILVATHFGPSAQTTYIEACALARAFGAEIVLAHAVSMPAVPEFGLHEERACAAAQATRRCEEIARRLAEREGIRFGAPAVALADPAEWILRAAEAQDADLVVLGGADRSALGTLLFNPVLERVMRKSRRPVWLARPAPVRDGLDRILCVVDPTRPTGKALRASLHLARTFAARLDLFMVVPAASLEAGLGAEQVTWLERYLETYSSASERAGVEIECLAQSGLPGARIVEVAAAQGSDLLVIGSGGRVGLRRWLRGNTTERAARVAPCSLLSVRTLEPGESGRLSAIWAAEAA